MRLNPFVGGRFFNVLALCVNKLALNDLCRKLGKKFYAAGCHGLGGYIFVDLEVHEYIT